MNKTLTFAIGMPVAVVFVLSSLTGCKKKEEEPPPPPIPAAAPAPPPAPVPVVVEVDAGPVAGPDAAVNLKKAGKGALPDPSGLHACCTALEQNAASMPAPNNGFALQAAALCKAAVAAGAGKGGVMTQIAAAMKGANLPPACK
jgi:hypothetical protein